METIEFSLAKLLEHSLSFEDYFLLHSINFGRKNIFITYARNIKPIETSRLERLRDNGWVEYTVEDNGDVLFDSITLTDKNKVLFPSETLEQCFDELKKTYPKTVGNRVLHLDNRRSKELYTKTIVKNGVIDLEMHKLILKCIQEHVKKAAKSGGLPYLQALPTFLHQRNWEPYIEEASKKPDIQVKAEDMLDIDNKQDV